MKTWISHNGVREELGIPEDAPVVGTVANFKAHKGHQFLMQAAAQVKRAIPNVRFVLVGLGPLENDVRKRAAALGLQDTVVFAGYREDAPRVAGIFDLFALASLQEGLAIALVEAMTLGKPAVVTSVGGLPEVVTDGQHGFLVRPRDVDGLAGAIVALLEDDDLRKRLGDNARNKAATFDIRNSVRRMEEVYEELLT